MKKLALLLVLVSVPSLAVPEYYEISRSVRAEGMGGAFYGWSDDEYALFYNPAGLGAYQGDARYGILGLSGELGSNTLSALKTLKNSKGQSSLQVANNLEPYVGDALYAGGGAKLLTYMQKHWAVGILLADVKADFAAQGSGLNTTVDATAIDDSGLFGSYAMSFLDESLNVGITGKALVRGGGHKLFSVDDVSGNHFNLDPSTIGGVGAGIDFDLGATYQLPLPEFGPFLIYRFSVVMNNGLATQFRMIHFKGGDPPGLPRLLTFAGYTALRGYGPFDNFHLLVDFSEFQIGGEQDPDLGARDGSFIKHVNLGVEAPMLSGWIVPRLGLHQGSFAAGLSFMLRAVRLDLATYAENLDAAGTPLSSRRFAATLVLGWGQAPEPPVKSGGPPARHEEKPAPKTETAPPPLPKGMTPPAEGTTPPAGPLPGTTPPAEGAAPAVPPTGATPPTGVTPDPTPAPETPQAPMGEY